MVSGRESNFDDLYEQLQIAAPPMSPKVDELISSSSGDRLSRTDGPTSRPKIRNRAIFLVEAGLVLVCYALCVYAFLDVSNIVLIYEFLPLTIIAGLLILAFYRISQLQPLYTYFTIIYAYFVFGYLFKLYYLLEYPDDFSMLSNVAEYLIGPRFGEALWLVVIYVAVSIVILYFVSDSKQHSETVFGPIRIQNLLAIAIIAISLASKLFLHYVLQWGIPGKDPAAMPPFIGGAIIFYVRLCLFFICNLYLYCVVRDRYKFGIFVAGTFIATFIALDLGIGSKFSLIYEVIFVVPLFAYAIRKRRLSLSFVVVLAGLGYAILNWYKYINYYRYAILQGYHGLDAVHFALNAPAANDGSTFADLIGRVSGVEYVLIVVSMNLQSLTSGFRTFFGQDFLMAFTSMITGISNANSAMGATQIGTNFVASHGNLTLFAAYAVITFTVTFVVIVRVVKLSLGNRVATMISPFHEVAAAILSVYFLFGSGVYDLFFREGLIIFLGLFAFRTVCFGRDSSSRSKLRYGR
ncbi:hypothetical protein [Mesorhizobium sp. M1399]|uniref:hypothetical protein n=1 Tax=Mesorhizobium sp. M1399 TaxID=2957096 RepID=UPI003338956A